MTTSTIISFQARTLVRAAACATAMFYCAPASAQKESAPPIGPAKDFRLPPSRTFTLDNGLRVTFIHFGAVPKAALQLNIVGGSSSEKPDEIWLANVTADLMKEGTTTRTAGQVANEAASMGGSLNLNVTWDETIISAEVLADRAADMARLMADVVVHPKLPDSELTRIKAKLARDLAIAKEVAQTQADEKLGEVLYPNHRYGRIFPTEAMLKGYGIDQVRQFYANNLAAQRAHLWVTGVFDDAVMERAVRADFSAWARGTPQPAVPLPPGPERRTLSVVDRPGAPQSTIRLGLRVPPPAAADYIPLRVTDHLLGGSFGSRVTSNIREDKGYSYSPYSFLNARKQSTYWNQTADVTTKDTGNSVREIFREIDRLSREPPPAAELRGMQTQLAGIFSILMSSRTGIIGQLAFADLQGLGDAYLTNFVKNVMAVTPVDVQRMTQTYLQPDKMTLVVVGDRKAIDDQLKPWTTNSPP